MRPAEALALASTTWLLADLLDDLGEEGQRERYSDPVVETLSGARRGLALRSAANLPKSSPSRR